MGEETAESDSTLKANMKKRRMIKRCAQMHKIQLFRRSIGADKDEVTAENIETATMKLPNKQKQEKIKEHFNGWKSLVKKQLKILKKEYVNQDFVQKLDPH